jgi:replication factor C subunit 3/5
MIPLFEKYRPNNSDELVLEKETRFFFESIMNEPQNMPNLIFNGPPGTGKTSSMLNLLKSIYKQNYHNYVLELNASDERNIKTVRENIKDFCETKNNFIKNYDTFRDFKVVVLDEVDSMTYDAQFCLRRMMETYSTNIRFVLICNYINKIILALQSRCCIIKFKHLNFDLYQKRLNNILDQENISINNKNLKFICYICNNDLRKTLNLIQNLTNYNNFDEKSISKYTGYPTKNQTKYLLYLILNDTNNILDKIKQFNEDNNLNIIFFIKEIYIYFLNFELNINQKIKLIKGLAAIENKYYFLMDIEISLINIISLVRNIFYKI